jgi:hypothetical protein
MQKKTRRTTAVGLQVLAFGVSIFVQQFSMTASLILGGAISVAGIVVALWPRVRSLGHSAPARESSSETFIPWIKRFVSIIAKGSPLVLVVIFAVVLAILFRGRINSGREVDVDTKGDPCIAETVEELVEPLRKVTTARAAAIAEKYIGKRVCIYGRFADLLPFSDSSVLYFEHGIFEPTVTVELNPGEDIIFSEAEKGDLLVISATIASANAYRLDLENVIILSESNSTILEASQRVLSGRPVKSASDQNEQSHHYCPVERLQSASQVFASM